MSDNDEILDIYSIFEVGTFLHLVKKIYAQYLCGQIGVIEEYQLCN